MTSPTTPTPTQGEKDKPSSTGGPTSPSSSEGKPLKGPKTGGYDDHSPDKTPSNRKGGYGTG